MQYARGLLAGLGEGIVRSATVRVFRRSALQARRGAEGNAAAYIRRRRSSRSCSRP